MATKAELEAELAQLKAQMAEREPPKPRAPESDRPDDAATAKATGSQAGGTWEGILKAQGIDPEDASALLEQLSKELGDLPHNKPLLTAIAAFGIGFMLGRMSK